MNAAGLVGVALGVVFTLLPLKARSVPLTYIFEQTKKIYLSRENIEYSLVKVVGFKGFHGLSRAILPINFSYIDREGNVLGTGSVRMNTTKCELVLSGQKCAEASPDLNIRLFWSSCSLSFDLPTGKKSIQWGECRTRNEGDADIRVGIKKEDFSDVLTLSFENIGTSSSGSFRVLVSFLALGGQEISYQLQNISSVESFGKTEISLSLGSLYFNTCKVKIYVDPDSVSQIKNRDQHILISNFGECSDELFEVNRDLSLDNLEISEINDLVKVEFKVLNLGDEPVCNDALVSNFEGYDRSGKLVWRDQVNNGGCLASKEQGLYSLVISKIFFEKFCSLIVEVNAASVMPETNKNNNKIYLNYCH